MASAADAPEVLAWEDLPVPARGRQRTSECTPPARRKRCSSPPRPHLGNTGAVKGLRAHTKGACTYCTPYMTRPRYLRACVAREARDANQMYAGCAFSSTPLDGASSWNSTPDSMKAASSLGSSMKGSGAGQLAALDQEWPVPADLGPLAAYADGMDTCEAHSDAEATDATQEWESVAGWDLEEAQGSWAIVELKELPCQVASASTSEADTLDDWTVL